MFKRCFFSSSFYSASFKDFTTVSHHQNSLCRRPRGRVCPEEFRLRVHLVPKLQCHFSHVQYTLFAQSGSTMWVFTATTSCTHMTLYDWVHLTYRLLCHSWFRLQIFRCKWHFSDLPVNFLKNQIPPPHGMHCHTGGPSLPVQQDPCSLNWSPFGLCKIDFAKSSFQVMLMASNSNCQCHFTMKKLRTLLSSDNGRRKYLYQQ